ncbi:unnamed protein product [Lymnaea stagnalis]|uniref:Uncharacterized protein n=1 Tax=Lymnaea stagnalis TaxID=6523 RepID=A0AAV2HKW7_LYMST
MGVNVIALVVLVVFYLAILVVGLVAAWKVKVKGKETGVTGGMETSLVAGRDLKTIVGIFTMIATTVGGGYINGTAESVAKDGIAWTLAPIGIFIGLNLGGAVYARRMREREYLTMLDPFQKHYGNTVTILIYLASLMGDLLWSASILNALGTTLSVIADIQLYVAVIMSGSVTIIYTMIGSMIAVAYTDILQLFFILVGLVTCLPFIFTNDKIGDLGASKEIWIGKVDTSLWGIWVDLFIAMTLGTIPWQSYFQRVLSVRTAFEAQILSFVGAFGAVVLVVPSVLIGIAGASADWNSTSLGESPIGTNRSSLVLPLVIHEFTPFAVSVLGLGAISAAVMSSMDSAVLGTSSMFTHNIYREMLRRKASKKELKIIHVSAVIFFGCACMFIALSSSVIYGMFILAADFVFVIIFPQLTAILYVPHLTNTIGAVCGFVVGLLLRLGAGDDILRMPVWIYYPFYDEVLGQLFPFRTFAMLMSLFTVLIVTFLTRLEFVRRIFKKCENDSDEVELTGHLMMNKTQEESTDSRQEKAKFSRTILVESPKQQDSGDHLTQRKRDAKTAEEDFVSNGTYKKIDT